MNRARALVLASIAALVLLAGALGVRLLNGSPSPAKAPDSPRMARNTLAAPPASVPAPKPVGALTVPCWGCPEAKEWPIAFRTDLDQLAPLGNGPANAGLWLKDFTKQVGAREAEAEQAMNRRVDGPGDFGKILPGDDPLLAEAEPWADQGTMRIYPDAIPLQGFQTRIPNLLLALTLTKSWAARAAAHPDSPAALEDCRRAIRWGRLLRQEDMTILQDLVGIACIRLGAEQLYAAAVRRGDQPLALASAIALGEHAPQRLKTAEVLTRLELAAVDGFEPTHAGSVFKSGRTITEPKLAALLETSKASPNRRFRLEAIAQMQLARQVGASAQRARVEAALDILVGDPDSLVAAAARYARTMTIDDETLAAILKPTNP